jgi:CheY-like chemotaxis protein
MVRQCPYDLILLDLNLPRLDGLAFCGPFGTGPTRLAASACGRM